MKYDIDSLIGKLAEVTQSKIVLRQPVSETYLDNAPELPAEVQEKVSEIRACAAKVFGPGGMPSKQLLDRMERAGYPLLWRSCAIRTKLGTIRY